MRYAPKRAGMRWREGAPDYILDCFYHRGLGDCYTVLLGREFVFHTKKDGGCAEGPDTLANTYIPYLGMSGAPTHPQGISQWGEFKARDAAAYRYRSGHRRVRWLDLPENIRQHVINRAKETEL